MQAIVKKLSVKKCSAIILVFIFAVAIFSMSSGIVHADSTTGLNNPTNPVGGITPGSASTVGSAKAGIASIFDDIGYYVIGKVAFGISYLIAWIMGVLIAIEAWLVGAVLGINQGIFQADIVQKGFGVTLSIANLGFVLGIIIIAIATILQRETYGYKKTLWKLIAAAILVNFSLVIASPLFSLGNSFTQYFLTCVDPGGGGCGGQGAGIGITSQNSMNDFAAGLAGAFNPQVGLLGNPNPNAGAQPAGINVGASFSEMLIPILSIAFVAAELVAIVIVLGSLITMLFVRYVYIAILAILMPFAWLGWVFPSTQNWWSRWWSEFIRWTFFPPIVVFFLWLAIQTAQSMRNGTAIANQQFGTYTSAANSPMWAALSNFTTATFSPIIGQVLNTILLIGLSVGGIIVANKLSITGASTATTAAKAVGGFAKKQAKKAGRYTYDRGLKLPNRLGGKTIIPSGKTITSSLQEGRIGKLQYIPGAKRVASLAGRGIASVSTNEELVENAKKNVPKNPEEIRTRLKGSMNKEDQLAHIAKLIELGEYKGDEIINQKETRSKVDELMPDGTIKKRGTIELSGPTASEFLDANKESGLIERYGQGKLVKDADKAVISDAAMRNAQKEFDKVATAGGNTASALKKLDDATKAFLEKLNKGDISKANVNGILGQDTAISKAITKGFITSNPELIPDTMKKMNKVTLKQFVRQYNTAHDEEMDRIVNDPALTDLQKTTELDELQGKLDKFNKALGNNALGLSTPDTPTPAPTPPPPHP